MCFRYSNCLCSIFPASKTEILGGFKLKEAHDVYMRLGDMVNLTCIVTGTNAPPNKIFWYHEDKVSIDTVGTTKRNPKYFMRT